MVERLPTVCGKAGADALPGGQASGETGEGAKAGAPTQRHVSGPRSRLRIAEVIVVEGLHDKQAVERVADADIWVLGGDRIPRHRFSELVRAAETRGVIILTDPDGPGERIRRRLADALPGAKHAFLPRAAAVAKNGRALGVEHAGPDAIARALLAARPTRPAGSAAPIFTMADLIAHGLAGGAGAAERRRRVGEALGIGYANAQAFLRKLNALGVTRAEWEAAVAVLDEAVPAANAAGAADNWAESATGAAGTDGGDEGEAP